MYQLSKLKSKELKNSESAFKLVLNSIYDAILMIDQNGKVIFCNQVAINLWEFTQKELLGKTVEELMPERFRKKHRGYFLNYMKAPVARPMGLVKNLWLETKNHVEVPVEISLNPIHFNNKFVILCSIHNITFQKRNEEKLIQQSNLMQLMFDTINAISNEENFETGLRHSLSIICTGLHWPMGHVYLVTENGDTLIPSDIWYLQDPEKFKDFYSITMKTNFSYNVGLPGLALAKGAPVWFKNVATETSFPRVSVFKVLNIHNALAFPIKVNAKTIAIFEFFSHEEKKQDDTMMLFINILNNQINRFVEYQKIQENRKNLLRTLSEKSSDLENLNKKLEKYAYYDFLTGLMNRKSFEDAAKRLLSKAKRGNLIIGLMFIDLDFFKKINDNFGHHMGDKVLKEVATRLAVCIRKEDILGRIGGDEFLLLVEVNDYSDINVIIKTVVDTLREPFKLDENSINITISIGVSFYPSDGLEYHELLEKADTALLRAKDAGRDRVLFYSETKPK